MTAPVLPAIRVKVLTDAVSTRLSGLVGDPTVTVYRGEVRNADGTTDPPVMQFVSGADPGGRVAPYAVVFPGVGNPSIEPNLADSAEELLWPVFVTVVAGFETDCEQTVDRVKARLYRWIPTVSGLVCGPLRPPPGYDPGPIRKDITVKPPRFTLPLQYVVPVTT